MSKVLISNDDGVDSEGLKILYEHLKRICKVFVIAPSQNQSGAGSSISTKRPLSTFKNSDGFIGVNGTPVDCVHLGLNGLCPFKPDLIVSGINYGANMAEDLLYSGTVGAALEGKDLPLPCIAISAAAYSQPGNKYNELKPNFSSAALVTKSLVECIGRLSIDSTVTLNVNVPNLSFDEIEHTKITTLGSWGPRNPPLRETNSKGEDKFWITHRDKVPKNTEETDIATLARGSVSITPIISNFKVAENANILKDWVDNIF